MMGMFPMFPSESINLEEVKEIMLSLPSWRSAENKLIVNGPMVTNYHKSDN